jgi:alpha-L-fucosidase
MKAMRSLVSVIVGLFCVGCSRLPALGPMPVIPKPLPVDSVAMGDSKGAPEVKLDLPVGKGPFEPTWKSIEANYPGTPDWLRQAKFGIWVHFGPQAAGRSGDWYARRMYIPGTDAYKNHLRDYGHPSESGYKEVLRDWNPVNLDPAALTELYRDAGARFLMIQGVHHDNFDMWDSRYQPWNAARMGPKRDMLGEWAKACRANGMRFGVTFHHEYTWWWWQGAFGSDKDGPMAGVPYDGTLTPADGKGKWWEGLDPRLLYGIDLRQYKSVAVASQTDWNNPDAGIYTGHMDYAKWYARRWALRMMDVIEKYDPDFIYTDGTGQQPFSGNNTGTGLKADAMQRVIAYYYNRTIERRGKVDTFSIVKFRKKTNGTVTTVESGLPDDIKLDQAWIAEVPVGDWFYRPGFTYDSGMMIRYIIEAASCDGCAAICISPRPDGSLDDDEVRMLREVGAWMRCNGEGIYGSRAWSLCGEGEMVDGKLKRLPNGPLGGWQAGFKFGPEDFRFTVGASGRLYAYCMTVPAAGSEIRITSLGTDARRLAGPVGSVSLLGSDEKLTWSQRAEGLVITCPEQMPSGTSICFKISAPLSDSNP